MTTPEPSAASPTGDARSAPRAIVAALALPLSPASAEPLRPLPLVGLHQLSRDTTMLYGVGRVDASGRVKNRDIVRALGWQPGDKLEVIPGLGWIVIFSSPDGLSLYPLSPASLSRLQRGGSTIFKPAIMSFSQQHQNTAS